MRVDGSLGFTFSRAIPLFDANGAVVEWIGAASDVTARKQAEEAFRESEERFRLLVHGVKDCAIYMVALDGTVSSWSAAAEQIFGYREEEIVGQHRRVFFTGEQREAGRPQQDLVEALALGRSEQEEWRVTKDGARFWANVLITPLYDDGGSLRGFANVTRDFTERKRAEGALRESEERLRASEAALREADRRKDEFLAMLSHELRNPLAPIRNSLYILDRAAPGGTQATEAQAIIDRQVAQLTRLVDDLLDVTRIARGKIQLQRERLDLTSWRAAPSRTTGRSSSKSGIRLRGALRRRPRSGSTATERASPRSSATCSQNAAKFTPHGGEVDRRARSARDGRGAVLTVRDTGVGIEPEHAAAALRAVRAGRAHARPQQGRARARARAGEGARRDARRLGERSSDGAGQGRDVHDHACRSTRRAPAARAARPGLAAMPRRAACSSSRTTRTPPSSLRESSSSTGTSCEVALRRP